MRAVRRDAAPLAVVLAGSSLFAAAVLADLPMRAFFADQDPSLRALWAKMSMLGNSGWMLAATIGLAGFAWSSQRRARSARWRAGLAEGARTALFAAICVGGLGLLASVLKLAIGRPRPKMFDEAGAFDLDFLAFSYKMNSLPSGHATTALAMAAALALILPRWRPLFLAIGLWTAASRVAVGAHYVSDVVAGAALGWFGTGFLAEAAARRRVVFGPDLRLLHARESAAALRLAARRASAEGRSAMESAYERVRAAFRHSGADEERGWSGARSGG
jgi:membrane-associated phospholipid phosphatase